MPLYRSRAMNARIGESLLSEGGDTRLVISSEPCEVCVCMCVSCKMTWVLIVLWLDHSMLAGRPKNEGRSMSGRELIRDW